MQNQRPENAEHKRQTQSKAQREKAFTITEHYQAIIIGFCTVRSRFKFLSLRESPLHHLTLH